MSQDIIDNELGPYYIINSEPAAPLFTCEIRRVFFLYRG